MSRFHRYIFRSAEDYNKVDRRLQGFLSQMAQEMGVSKCALIRAAIIRLWREFLQHRKRGARGAYLRHVLALPAIKYRYRSPVARRLSKQVGKPVHVWVWGLWCQVEQERGWWCVTAVWKKVKENTNEQVGVGTVYAWLQRFAYEYPEVVLKRYGTLQRVPNVFRKAFEQKGRRKGTRAHTVDR